MYQRSSWQLDLGSTIMKNLTFQGYRWNSCNCLHFLQMSRKPLTSLGINLQQDELQCDIISYNGSQQRWMSRSDYADTYMNGTSESMERDNSMENRLSAETEVTPRRHRGTRERRTGQGGSEEMSPLMSGSINSSRMSSLWHEFQPIIVRTRFAHSPDYQIRGSRTKVTAMFQVVRGMIWNIFISCVMSLHWSAVTDCWSRWECLPSNESVFCKAAVLHWRLNDLSLWFCCMYRKNSSLQAGLSDDTVKLGKEN